MAIDLSALSTLTTSATALSNLVLVTPNSPGGVQPQPKTYPDGTQDPSPPAFLFDFEGENKFSLKSEITDHYVEDNTAINDQIALAPEIITTQGFVSELNDIIPKNLSPLGLIADKLAVLGAYVPALSATARLVTNEATQLYAVGKLASAAGVSAWNTITGGAGAAVLTKQQTAFSQFYGYWQNRTLFTVQTPWGTLGNMAIQSLDAVQDEDTRMVSTFAITFKKMRFAKTISTNGTQAQMNGRINAQAAPVINNGSNALTTSSTTFSSGLAAQTKVG